MEQRGEEEYRLSALPVTPRPPFPSFTPARWHSHRASLFLSPPASAPASQRARCRPGCSKTIKPKRKYRQIRRGAAPAGPGGGGGGGSDRSLRAEPAAESRPCRLAIGRLEKAGGGLSELRPSLLARTGFSRPLGARSPAGASAYQEPPAAQRKGI